MTYQVVITWIHKWSFRSQKKCGSLFDHCSGKPKDTEAERERGLRATDLKIKVRQRKPPGGQIECQRPATSFALVCYKMCIRKNKWLKRNSLLLGSTGDTQPLLEALFSLDAVLSEALFRPLWFLYLILTSQAIAVVFPLAVHIVLLL